MSRSVDLFISSDAPIEALADLIAARTGLKVDRRQEGDDAFEVHDHELIAVLHRHRFVDDDDLPLSRYAYALSMRTQGAGHLGSSPEVSVLRRVAAALSDAQVLLVLDLQYRAATAEGVNS